MHDWISDAVKRIEKDRERRRKNEECKEAISRALKANGPGILETLRNAVEADVALFNTHFPEATKKLSTESIGEVGFWVKRQYPPDFLLTARLREDRNVIEWEITRSGSKLSGIFEAQYDESGGHLLENGIRITFEEASRKLIIPAIEGLV